MDQEAAITQRERSLDKEAERLAASYLKSAPKLKKIVADARRDAVKRSHSTLLGSLFERLGPLLKGFTHNPRDLRSVLNPIDFVCFDGLAETGKVDHVAFIEVKSGTSTLSPRQRSIRKAVENGCVSFEELQIGQRGVPLPKQLRLESATIKHPAAKSRSRNTVAGRKKKAKSKRR